MKTTTKAGSYQHSAVSRGTSIGSASKSKSNHAISTPRNNETTLQFDGSIGCYRWGVKGKA